MCIYDDLKLDHPMMGLSGDVYLSLSDFSVSLVHLRLVIFLKFESGAEVTPSFSHAGAGTGIPRCSGETQPKLQYFPVMDIQTLWLCALYFCFLSCLWLYRLHSMNIYHFNDLLVKICVIFFYLKPLNQLSLFPTWPFWTCIILGKISIYIKLWLLHHS